jgi:hypothetical protein
MLNSGVKLPADVQEQLDKSFDKANGDYFHKITH